MTEPDYSTPIFAIADWLRRNGVAVNLYASRLLPPLVGGRYIHPSRTILINEIDASAALMALAHEAGHWLGYVIDEKRQSFQRERQAFAYGWWVLRQFDAPISRAEWIADERERRSAPAMRTCLNCETTFAAPGGERYDCPKCGCNYPVELFR